MILAVLAHGIDGDFRVFETTYLKSLVADQGGPADRRILRRTIGTLLDLGYLEERIVNGRYYYELAPSGSSGRSL